MFIYFISYCSQKLEKYRIRVQNNLDYSPSIAKNLYFVILNNSNTSNRKNSCLKYVCILEI